MILRKGLLTILIQLFQLVALVGTTVLVTRVTGAHGRGIYALVYSLATLAAMVTALGISWAGIYYIGKRLFPLADVASTLLTASLAAAGRWGVQALAALSLLDLHAEGDRGAGTRHTPARGSRGRAAAWQIRGACLPRSGRERAGPCVPHSQLL